MAPLPDHNKTTLQTKQDKDNPQDAKEQQQDVKYTSEELGGEPQTPVDKPKSVKGFQQIEGKFPSGKDQLEAFGTGSQYSVAKSKDKLQFLKDQCQDSEGDSQDANDQYQDAKDQFEDSEVDSEDPKVQTRSFQKYACNSYNPIGKAQEVKSECQRSERVYSDGKDGVDDQGAKFTIQTCKHHSQTSEGDLQDVSDQFEDSEAEPYVDRLQIQAPEAKSHKTGDNCQEPMDAAQNSRGQLKDSKVGESADDPPDCNLHCAGSLVQSSNSEISQSCTDSPHLKPIDEDVVRSSNVISTLGESIPDPMECVGKHDSFNSKILYSENDPQAHIYDTNEPQISESLDPLIKTEDSENQRRNCNIQYVAEDAENKSNDSKIPTSQGSKDELEQSAGELQFWNCSSQSEDKQTESTDQCLAAEVIPQQSEGSNKYCDAQSYVFKEIDPDVIDRSQDLKMRDSEGKSLASNLLTETSYQHLNDRLPGDQLQDSQLHDCDKQFEDSGVNREDQTQDAAAGYRDLPNKTQTMKGRSERAKQKYGLNYVDCREEKEIVSSQLHI